MQSAQLIHILENEPCGAGLNQAFTQLGSGADLDLLLAMIKSMTRGGIPGLAVRLLTSGGVLLEEQAELAQLAAQLSALPSGEVSTAQIESNYRRNRARLLDTRPHLREFETDFDAAGDGLRVFQATNGYTVAIRDAADGRFVFALPLIGSAGDVMKSFNDCGHNTTAIAMSGVPSLDLWLQLLDVRSAAGFRPPIEIVEPDLAVLGVWLRLIDRSEALEDERVGVFAGGQARTQYLGALRDNPQRLLPTHFLGNVRTGPTLERLDDSMFTEIVDLRLKRRQTLVRKQEIRYGGRDANYLAKRFQPAGSEDPPLRVAGFTTRHSTVIQFALRDLAAAFRKHGCIFDIITEPDDYTSDVDLGGALADTDYDLIVVINHMRFEYGDQIHSSIPYVCWIQDHMPELWTGEAGASLSKNDMVVCRSSSFMAEHFGYPRKCLLGSSNLTSTTTYSDEPVAPEDLEPFRCDVSYVGHGWQTGHQLAAVIAPDAPEVRKFLERFIELAADRNADKGWLNYFDRLELCLEAQRESDLGDLHPEQRATLLLPAVGRVYDRLFRHEALQWCAAWATNRNKTFRIYGNGWENHPMLSEYAVGPVQNGYELRCLSQASAVNLQVNGYDSLHQRLLDGLASGGCVISRFNPTDYSQLRFQEISHAIRDKDLAGLEQLRSEAKRNPGLEKSIREAEAWSGLSLAPSSSDERRRNVEVLKAFAHFPESICRDEAWFETLRTMKSMADRVAGNIDGFDQSTFNDRDQLHDLLDRLVDDPRARDELAKPMKQSILKHDTHDVLVKRILEAFRHRYESLSHVRPAPPVEA